MSAANAQTILQQESFETNGEGTRYTSSSLVYSTAPNSTSTQANNQYFQRATSDGTTTTIPNGYWSLNPVLGGDLNGTWYWACEAVRGPANDLRRPSGVVTLSPVNVTNYGALKVRVAFMDARTTGRFERDDMVSIQIRFDGTGDWITVGQFVGNTDANSAGTLFMRQDTNLDGTSTDPADVNSRQWTQTMADYEFNVAGSGSTMETRIVVNENGLSEEFAFDNIRVVGTVSTNAAPVLTGLESTPLSYSEGDPATIITNELTVNDTDNPTLSGATVKITTNFDGTEDRLLFTNANGITGTYSTTTGILSLSGTATLANYQAALRSVRYQNIDAVDPLALPRRLTFAVTDAATVPASSAAVSRTITITAFLVTAALPYSEDFETDGEGIRYSSNHYLAGNGSAFFRTNLNPVGSGGAPGAFITFTNISNAYYWYTNVVNNGANPNAVRSGFFQTQPVNAANTTNLRFQIRLGAHPNAWESIDYVRLYYRTGGSTGNWTIFGSFRGDVSSTTSLGDGQLRQDVDPTNLSGLPTGPALTGTLTNFDFPLPAAVNNQRVDFKLEMSSDEGTEQFAFDLIQVTGTPTSPPVIANQTRVIAENSVNGATVGAALVASDPDAGQTLSYSITGGNTNTTFAINPTTGQLTVANSAALNYEVTPSYALTVQVADTGTPPLSSSAIITVTITNVNELTATVSAQNNLSCNGGANGSATVTASGESAPFSFLYRNTTTNTTLGGTTSAVTGLTAGVYTVTVTATASSFTTTTSFTITQPPALTLATSSTNVTTNGGSNGAASVTVTGGVPGYSYNWTPGNPAGDGTTTITGLSAGSYTITVTDANGCTANRSLTIIQPTATPQVNTPANGSLINTATPTYTGTATAGSTVTVVVDGASSGTATATNGNWSLLQPTPLSQGAHTVYARAQGNGQPISANSPTNSFTVDTASPSVTLTTTASTTTTTIPIPFTASFSESVTGLISSDIAVSNGSVSNLLGGGSLYSFSVVPSTGGTVSVSIGSTMAQDGAGNGNTASNTISVSFVQLATVTTAVPGNITATQATLGGTIMADGSAPVTERGVVYVVGSGTPMTGDIKATFGSGLGSFGSAVAGLTPGTVYSVRAYAINSVGTAYGNVQRFTTPNTPSVVTTPATSVTVNNASLGGTVTADGGATVTERGVVYSASNSLPTTADTKVMIGQGTGSFTQTMGDLTPGTTYWVRAYALNSIGITYGSVESFTTPFPTPTLSGLVANPPQVCSGSVVTFTATVGSFIGSYSYTLTNGVNAVTGTGGSSLFRQGITVTGSGSQRFTLRVLSNGQSAQQTTSVLVDALPSPTVFTTNTPDGLIVQIGGGVYYERVKTIDRVNGYEIRQTEQNQTGRFLITQPGPYSVTVIGANDCRTTVTGIR